MAFLKSVRDTLKNLGKKGSATAEAGRWIDDNAGRLHLQDLLRRRPDLRPDYEGADLTLEDLPWSTSLRWA